jgi:D-alanyl-D-alanine-carboxypeptidase/D-alanyl-D-alanine-endopeptidase
MPEPQQRLRTALARVRPRRAGLVVGVWDGQRVATWHAGRVPDRAASIFEIGSITKVFTATLLVDMAREGLVALDDPVQRHLPEGVRMPERGRPITLEDLSSHRSGLPRLPKGLLRLAFTRDRRDPYARIDAPSLEAALERTRPRREPERRAAYSNYGAGLLGHVLARRAGCSYDELVRRRIAAPLGLHDTGTAVDGGRLATGHSRLGRPVGHWHFDALAGAGALRSTATDLIGFLRLHAGEPAGPLADAVREMQVPRMRRGRVGFGLGWVIVPPRGRVPYELLVHDGGTGGFRSFAAVSPQRRVAVVVLANQVRDVSRIALRALGAMD